jgi:hypothetical protein
LLPAFGGDFCKILIMLWLKAVLGAVSPTGNPAVPLQYGHAGAALLRKRFAPPIETKSRTVIELYGSGIPCR